MEWWEKGRYTIEPHHAPLSRILSALPPYLAGLRGRQVPDMYVEGYTILQSKGDFRENVTLSRVGLLAFFALACAAVYLLARRVTDGRWSVVAVLLFVTTPPILAHAGLATTDVALTGTLALSVWCWIRYLDRPTHGRAAGTGAAMALAALSKLSALLFLPLSIVVILLAWHVSKRHSKPVRSPYSPVLIATAVLAGAFVLWAGYRFSLAPLTTAAGRPHGPIERLVPEALGLRQLANWLVELPVPAQEFFIGIRDVAAHNSAGHSTYMLGEKSMTGWWYFFPVAIAVKTPLALLLAVGIGYAALLWRRRRAAVVARTSPTGAVESDWALWAIALVPVILVLSAMTSRINIGLRHVLPIYPMFAVLAAIGLRTLWGRLDARAAGAFTGAVLVAQLFSVVSSYPSYLCYFNPTAGPEPEQVLVYSDCDWNQDYTPLADTLRARGITKVAVGAALPIPESVLKSMGYPDVVPLVPGVPISGWVATDAYHRTIGSPFIPGVDRDSYAWLAPYPYIRVGTIRLYHVPEAGASR
jgi:hypothetical protein